MANGLSPWKRIVYVLPALAVAAAIFYLSSLENIDLPLEEFAYNDLLAHAAAYFVFGMTLVFASFPSERLRKEPVLTYALLFAIGMAYGLSDEIHQSFVPNRVASLADFFADTFGVALALVVSHVVLRRRMNRRTSKIECGSERQS